MEGGVCRWIKLEHKMRSLNVVNYRFGFSWIFWKGGDESVIIVLCFGGVIHARRVHDYTAQDYSTELSGTRVRSEQAGPCARRPRFDEWLMVASISIFRSWGLKRWLIHTISSVFALTPADTKRRTCPPLTVCVLSLLRLPKKAIRTCVIR